MKNNSQKMQQQNVEQNLKAGLENLEISLEQAQIVQDDELKMVTGGAISNGGMEGPRCYHR